MSFYWYWLIAYLLGSLPFALWITRLVKNVDVRDVGSGHATTTNTVRQAGFGAGAVVLLLDLSKGFLPVWLAHRAGLPSWAVALTAAFGVLGHCYPVFADFRGGMGLAVTGGALLAVSPPAMLVALALLLLLLLTVRHAARSALFAGLLTPFLLWGLNFRGVELWIMAAAGVILALRFAVNWNRQYRELWLDR
jgi:glycerol-3-phosphate acyltransferase PlsY